VTHLQFHISQVPSKEGQAINLARYPAPFMQTT
jgi:hypothetical protein